jgi:MerR family transcriptional regulator/heat shock protein HspR
MARREHSERRYVMISAVAARFEIHPQTLRLYEREGLIQPVRSAGNTRLYDETTLQRLETILTLTREMGVNLAGVEVILNLRQQMASMEAELSRLLEVLERESLDRAAGIDRRFALEKVESGPLSKAPPQDRRQR